MTGVDGLQELASVILYNCVEIKNIFFFLLNSHCVNDCKTLEERFIVAILQSPSKRPSSPSVKKMQVQSNFNFAME